MTPFKLFIKAKTDSGANDQAGVAVSSTNTYYSKMITGRDVTQISLVLDWTGTPTGTFTLWFSDKLSPNEANDTDWRAVTWTPTNPAGSASGFTSAITAVAGYKYRVKYVNSSGSGTLTGSANVTRSA